MAFLVTILFNLFILGLWQRYRKKREKKLAWYWGWILPSEVISLSLLALIGIAATTMYAFDTFPIRKKRTINEMNKIKSSILKYHDDTGSYPTSLQELIGQNPLRQSWKSDSWNTSYRLTHQMLKITITSAGSDRQFGTVDDIRIEIDN